jgi:hypothetical protein
MNASLFHVEKLNRGLLCGRPLPTQIALRGHPLLAELGRLGENINISWIVGPLSTPQSGRLLRFAMAVEFAVTRLVSGSLAGLIVYGGYRMFML